MGAQCTYMIDGPERRLSEAEWLEIELGRISFSSDDWGDMRRFVEEVCVKYKGCVIEDITHALDWFEARLDMIEVVEAVGANP